MTRIATGAPDLPDPPHGQHWVFHRGALGDSVLLWPMLRHWKRRGLDVVLVTDQSKSRLAERELGIRGEDAESPRFNRLWVSGVAGSEVEPVRMVQGVTAYLGADDQGLRVWRTNAGRMFPGASVRLRHQRPDRPHAQWYPVPALNPCDPGAIVMHVGAGSEKKRWPLERWLALADLLAGEAGHAGSGSSGTRPRPGRARAGARRVRLIAGEVEREQFSAADQEALAVAGGEFLFKLDDLAAAVRSARMFIAADCGPGHLAAQMGVPTISLFGPTDPGQWAPVGPAVHVLAPPSPGSMDWLEPGVVATAIRDLSRSVYGKPG